MSPSKLLDEPNVGGRRILNRRTHREERVKKRYLIRQFRGENSQGTMKNSTHNVAKHTPLYQIDLDYFEHHQPWQTLNQQIHCGAH